MSLIGSSENGLKKAVNILLWVLVVILLLDALLFKGQHDQPIFLAFGSISLFSFILSYEKPLGWTLIVTFLVALGLFTLFSLARMADLRKDSLPWQVGAAVGIGFFCSGLCLFLYSLSFPFYKSFVDRPIMTKRLRFFGKLCVVLPILGIPLMIILVVQQYHHQPYGILPEVLTGLIGVGTIGSLVPFGYLLFMGAQRGRTGK